MRVVVITPPAPVVKWEEADAHLKLDGDADQRAEVEAMVAAATATLDGPDGWLGRALGVQVLEARLDAFDDNRGSIFLPFLPIVAVETISYLLDSGGLATVDTSGFDLIGSEVVPAYRTSWPHVNGERREGVRIRYTAGYAPRSTDSGEVSTLPAPIRAAILLMVGDLYRNRDTTAASIATAVPMSTTVENLLAPFRVFS